MFSIQKLKHSPMIQPNFNETEQRGKQTATKLVGYEIELNNVPEGVISNVFSSWLPGTNNTGGDV